MERLLITEDKLIDAFKFLKIKEICYLKYLFSENTVFTEKMINVFNNVFLIIEISSPYNKNKSLDILTDLLRSLFVFISTLSNDF